jgi:hypothetical protein
VFAVMRMYRLEEGDIDEYMHRVDEEFADRLAEEPGFVSYQLVGRPDGMIWAVTVFRDQEGTDRSNELAAEFVRDRLADMQVTRTDVQDGEVMVSRAASEILQPAHH